MSVKETLGQAMALHRQNRLDEAEALYLQILKAQPDHADANHMLGVAACQRGDFERGIDFFSKAIKYSPQEDPENAVFHNNLGSALKELNRLDAAAQSYKAALEIDPGLVEAHFNIGNIFRDRDLPGDAALCYERALTIKPDYAEARSNLGNVLKDLGRLEDAIKCFEAVLGNHPDLAEVHYNLANTHGDLGRFDDAVECYRKAIDIRPDYTEAHNNLGNVFKELGKLDDAVASYQKAIALNPNFDAAYNNLFLSLSYKVADTTKVLLEEARRYGESVAARARPTSNHSNFPDPDRRLRVGLVSGDFSHHPVGYFLVGFISEISVENIELYAYSTSPLEDELTANIKSKVSQWKKVVGISDEQLAMDIINDGVDILVDLSGHTAKNRLPLFAWKPAPIQVTWLGYFAPTGVKAIDYILCDRWILPQEEENLFIETPYRLPDCYLCFTPPDFEIEVAPLPVETNGHITFGCFNNVVKMNESVISCWSKILHAVPDSRLFLKNRPLKDEISQQKILNSFFEHGISADRLIFEGNSPREELLETYNQVDICLDPFPFPGVTTSVEALWMGVPVVTLQGDCFMSHAGESILHNVGLDDWIASSPENYVEITSKHSSNLQKLAALRNGLRQRLVASPICDAPRFAGNLENAFRDMWHVWCAQQRDE